MHTALLHPSTPLPPLCTCLPSQRSTSVRPFPSPHRLLLTPVYAGSPRSASPPLSSHCSAVFLSPLCFSPVQSCPRHPQGYHPHQVRLLSSFSSISSHLPSFAKSVRAFGIILHTTSASELLASEAKAVTVLPIRAFYFFDFIRPPFVVHLSHHQILIYHGVLSIPRVLNSNHRLQ